MSDREKMADIETLAKMAARLAGRDPDEHVRLELADVVAFDGLLWRYPDFLSRAETAYEMLDAGTQRAREHRASAPPKRVVAK